MPYVVEILNNLKGEEISRRQLDELARQAEAEGQHHIADKITLLLRNHPGQKLFIIDAGSKPQEVLTDEMLCGLHCEHDHDDKIHGLGKAVSAEQIYTMITEKMVAMIKEASTKDYKVTWKQKGYLLPFNFVSKKRYRGINHVMLTEFGLLQNPFFLTFNQIENLGGIIKKGAHGIPVVYFTYLYKYERDGHDIASYDKEKFIHLLTEAGIKNALSVANTGRIPILKYYNVFNGADVTGIDFDLANFKTGFIESEVPANEDNRLPIAEAIVSHYPKPAPKIMHGGNEAFYRPSTDEVHMPDFAEFITAQDYYRTLFHELAHSTGSPERLNREKGKKFGDKAYAFEELVAEFSATFTSAEAGIIWHSNSNHAAYLKSWNSALTHMEDDNRFLMRAATQAQAATDFMLQPDKYGTPKYLKELERRHKQEETRAKKRTEKKEESKQLELQLNGNRGLNAATSVDELDIVEEPGEIDLNENEADTWEAQEPEALPVHQPEYVAPQTEPVNEEPIQLQTKEVASNPLVMSSDDLMKMHFETLQFTGEWREFMQEPAKNMKVAIWGKPKNGKTSGACAMADYITNFGNVLYNFADQGINKSTQDIWRNSGLDRNKRAFCTGVNTLDELEQLISTGDYDFVFIDMINHYIDNEKLKPFEFKERFIQKYPDVSFILVMEVNKNGNFKGDQGWTHIVDALVTVENFVMENRGRYGVGHYVVWKDGLLKFDPDKYAEIFGEESAPPPEQQPVPKRDINATLAKLNFAAQ